MIKTFTLDASRRPVLSWNERGAGEKYTVEVCTNLAVPNWTTAPGSWPITNALLADKSWTNPAALSANVCYRLRSVVP